MKCGLNGEDSAKLAGLNPVSNKFHSVNKSIGQIHCEQPIGMPGRFEHSASFGHISAEWLLAEHGQAMLERPLGLRRMERAGGRDNDPIEIHINKVVEV